MRCVSRRLQYQTGEVRRSVSREVMRCVSRRLYSQKGELMRCVSRRLQS